MADFNKALAYTLRHEGGWSDDPADPGGATNYGITLKTAQRHGIMTKDALRAITPAQVADIYRRDYWRFDGIDDQRVATKLFDMSVNMGPHAAGGLLALALARMGVDWGVATGTKDFGPMIGLVNAVPASGAEGRTPGAVRLLDCLCLESERRYMEIVAKRPASAKFLNGWLRRAAAVPALQTDQAAVPNE